MCHFGLSASASKLQSALGLIACAHGPLPLDLRECTCWFTCWGGLQLVAGPVGSELLDWAVESADVKGIWATEPAYEPPFSTDEATLSDFLVYLEKRGKVKVKMECHSLTRDKSGYKVSNTERVGYRMKDRRADSAHVSAGVLVLLCAMAE